MKWSLKETPLMKISSNRKKRRRDVLSSMQSLFLTISGAARSHGRSVCLYHTMRTSCHIDV